MEIHKIRPYISAAIPKSTVIAQGGCNVGLIQTAGGIILVDTSVSVKQMEVILKNAGIQPADVSLVINTHLHADHINGNSLFKCPVVCHKKAKNRMAKKCAKLGQSLTTFDDEYEMTVGKITLKLIHIGGHTPESLVVWLPEDKVLFSGDLIFSGRAPFLASVTNFNVLIKALKWLPTLGAEVIITGHGPLCDEGEIHRQVEYLETTWKIIKIQVEQGASLSEIRRNPNLPKLGGPTYELNIEWIYKRIKK